MDWELTIIVSVYPRQFWREGLCKPYHQPDAEQRFCCPLKGGYDPEDLRVALGGLVKRTEKWIGDQRVSLVTHLVVTVYSLEV